jgi:hypothetical protein
MKERDISEEGPVEPAALSKRAARRLIQRAFVLAGRDAHLHALIREAEVVTRWTLEDWNLEWSVILKRGKVAYDRRPARQPDSTLVWPAAQEFFAEAEEGFHQERHPTILENAELAKFLIPLARTFFRQLRHVLQFPVDEAGTRLA